MQRKKENPSVSRTPSFLSSPETLKTLGWKLSWGSLKFKSQSLGSRVWRHRASLGTKGSSGPRETLTGGTYPHSAQTHKVPHPPRQASKGLHIHSLTPQTAQCSLHIAKGYAITTMSHPLSLLNLSGCNPLLHSPQPLLSHRTQHLYPDKYSILPFLFLLLHFLPALSDPPPPPRPSPASQDLQDPCSGALVQLSNHLQLHTKPPASLLMYYSISHLWALHSLLLYMEGSQCNQTCPSHSPPNSKGIT